MIGAIKNLIKRNRSLLDAYRRFTYRRRRYSPSPLRMEGNTYFKQVAATVRGDVLHAGAGRDFDKMGSLYRWYFDQAATYHTLDLEGDVDFHRDLTDMGDIESNHYDCVFSPWVLEHIENVDAAVSEIHRVLKPGGLFLFGIPCNVAYHGFPADFWRFSKPCVSALLEQFEVTPLTAVGGLGDKGIDQRLRFYTTPSGDYPGGWVGQAHKR